MVYKVSYNYTKERNKWLKWKRNEEFLLKMLKVDERVIKQLRDYDWEVFKAERRIRYRQSATLDTFFNNAVSYDKKEIKTTMDLLDEIENEALFQYLASSDQVTLEILLLKMDGYSVNEISEILNVTSSMIYKRIQRLKNNLNNL